MLNLSKYRIPVFHTIFGLIILFSNTSTLFGQTQCANNVLNVALNTPTVPGGCGAKTISFNTNGTTSSSNASNRLNAVYRWFVNGVLIDSVTGPSTRSLTFNTAGSQTVRVVGRLPSTGCFDTATVTFNIPAATGILGVLDPPRVPTRTLNPIWTRCNTNPSNLDNTFTINVTTQNPDTLKNYRIIWGDGTPDNTGISSVPGNLINHTYTSLGEFTVSIINNNAGCIDTIRGVVRNLRPVTTTILPLPAGQLAGCAPHTITFQDSTGNALPGTTITWNFGSGQPSVIRNHTQANTPISYIYPRAASQICVFSVSITATNSNCPSPGPPSTTTISPILIYDVDDANISVPLPQCDSTRTVTFQNTSVLNCEPGNRRWYWDFGDGTNTGWITNGGSQTHTYPSFGVYTVMLVDSNFCGRDTAFFQFTVNRRPLVGFTMNPKLGCAPLNVTYADTSIGLGITRVWNFGSGSGITNRSDSTNTVTFTNPGTFVVTLTATNVCDTRTRRDTVRVFAKPAITINGAANGCVPHTVNLTSTVLNIRQSSAQYLWRFKGGTTSTSVIPPPIVYTTPGTDTVWLRVTDTCGVDSSFVVIRVSTLPTASFTSTQVCRGDSTTFTNTSTLAPGDVITAIKWFFGGTPNDSSLAAAPKYVYTNEGNFNAVLRITTDKGCVDFDTAIVNVKIAPVVSITSVNNVCDTSIVLFDGTATTALGTNIISHQWTFGNGIVDTARVEDTSYKYPGPGVYTVRYRANNSINCGTTVSKNITVNPLPDARLFASNLCFGQLAQMRDSSTVGFGNTITQWQWDFNNDNIADSIVQHPRHLFPSANTFKVKLRVGTNNNCFNTDSINITINPLPIVAISNNGNSRCKLDSFTYSNTTTGANNYRWLFGDASPDSITTSLAGIKKAYQDTGLYSVKMIATTALGCRDSSSFSVNVRPFPIAAFTVNDTISCAPKTFTFTNTSTLANNYTWRVNTTNTTTAFNRPDTVIATSGQTLQISLIATNIFGCRPDTAQRSLQTIANPTPNFIASRDSGCGPLDVNFTNTSIGATSFLWSLGNGNSPSTTNTSTTYISSQQNDSVYQVKLIAFNGPGCKDSITRQIKIFPKPISAFTQNVSAACGPLPVNFTNSSNHKFGGNIDSLLFAWRFGNGDTSNQKNPTSIYTASNIQDTNYNVRLIVTTRFGCKDTSQSTVKVFPNPRAQFNVSADNGCGPLGVNFINTSIPNDTGNINIMSFNWNFRNGNTSNMVSPTSMFNSNLLKDTIYAVRLIAFSEHGCRDTAFRNILVYPKPRASFVAATDSACTPFNAQFTNTSIPYDTGSIAIMSFVWDLGNGFGSVSQNAFSQYLAKPLADSSYTIRLIATSEHGCKDTTTQKVVAHPLPVAAFSNNVSQGCGPLNVQFTSNSQLAATHKWRFGISDSSSQNNPTRIFQSFPLFDSVITVSLSVQSTYGCKSDTVFGSIVTRAKPLAEFAPAVDSICGGGAVTFNNQSLGGVTNTWNFGNGQTASTINPIATFAGLPTADTTYTIRLIVTSGFGCRDTVFKPIKVNPLPDAEIGSVAPGCTPLPVSLANNSLRATRYEWDFGDGTTDTTSVPIKIFSTNVPLVTIPFTVTLNAFSRSGCRDTARRVITVYPKPIASFTPNVVDGCGPLNVSFTNQSASNTFGSAGINFNWLFGNGQTSLQQNPSTMFQPNITKDTVYTNQLITISEFGCRDTLQSTIRVYPKPKAQFTTSDTSGCSPLNIAFTNQSYPNDTGSISIMSFIWDFGNGINGISQDIVSQFTNTRLTDTTYRVRLIGTSEHGCRDTALKSITVRAKPVAAFTQDKVQGCGPFQVQFVNNSINSTQHKWLFGDGDTIGIQNPIHTFNSVPLVDTFYRVQLVTHSPFGCVSDTAFRNIFGRAIPIAQFTSSADSICNPGTISFFNNSQGGSLSTWNFGNGVLSDNINPVTTFTGPLQKDTIYQVRLIVTSPATCTDTAFKSIKVNPSPDAQFISPLQGCTPLPVLFNNTSLRAANYEWDFGDGSPLSIQNSPLKVFTNPLSLANVNYTVTLKAVSSSGCIDTAVRRITVFPLPQVNFTANKTQRCDTAAFSTINTTQGAFSFQWKTQQPVISNAFQPTLFLKTAPTQDTTYQIKLIATSLNGCRDSVVNPILVRPLVKADFASDGFSSCANLMVNFTNNSRNASSYFWLFGDATGSPLANPKHRYGNTGSYNVTLIAYDGFGCTDTAVKSNFINVYEVPAANFLYTPPQTAMPNSTIKFTNLTLLNTGTLSYQWDFGDNKAIERTSILKDPSFTYSDSGDYMVQMVARSNNNCFDTIYKSLRIDPHVPIASFTYDPPDGCSPHTVQFTNTSQYENEYFWDFGDATQSTEKNPVHTYTFPNKYNVYLRVRGPGGVDDTTMSQIIDVYPLPRANFIVTPLTLIIPNSTVTLTDISFDAVAWRWKISLDGLTYFETNQQTSQYTFTDEGRYSVSLIAISKDGCEDTLQRDRLVNVIKGGNRFVSNAFTPDGDGVNDAYKPVLQGAVQDNYEFEIFDRWGKRVFKTNDINQAWDGTVNGVPANSDVYVWILSGRYVGNISFSDKGNVTLIR